jgi:hypothetical protein
VHAVVLNYGLADGEIRSKIVDWFYVIEDQQSPSFKLIMGWQALNYELADGKYVANRPDCEREAPTLLRRSPINTRSHRLRPHSLFLTHSSLTAAQKPAQANPRHGLLQDAARRRRRRGRRRVLLRRRRPRRRGPRAEPGLRRRGRPLVALGRRPLPGRRAPHRQPAPLMTAACLPVS